MNIEQQQAVSAEVFAALDNGRLELPTLPDMALKIREAVDDPNVSADALIRLLSTDPSISAQIIKTANSAAFTSGTPVSDLRTAVSRLGYRMLRNMVMIVTMSKLFEARNPIISREMKNLWDHSREVAANSYVIALQQKHLKPDLAMLEGLVHDLGTLPLCLFADRNHPELDQDTLDNLIRKFHTEIGVKLLASWNFPADLVDVVAQHGNLQRMTADGVSDYIDVVSVANLMMPSTIKFVAWENVRAIDRLGYSTSQCINFLDTNAEQLTRVREMLGFTQPAIPKPKSPTAPAIAQRAPVRSTNEQTDSKSGMLSGLLKLFK